MEDDLGKLEHAPWLMRLTKLMTVCVTCFRRLGLLGICDTVLSLWQWSAEGGSGGAWSAVMSNTRIRGNWTWDELPVFHSQTREFLDDAHNFLPSG